MEEIQSRAQEEALSIKRQLLETEATHEYLREPGLEFLERFGLDPYRSRGDEAREHADLEAVSIVRRVFRSNGLRFRSDPEADLSAFFEQVSLLGETLVVLDREAVPWPKLDDSGAISATYVLRQTGYNETGSSADPDVRARPTVSFISPTWLWDASVDGEELDTKQRTLLRWIQNVGPGSARSEVELILPSEEQPADSNDRVSRKRGLSEGAATTVSFWPRNRDGASDNGIAGGRLSYLVTASRDFPWVIISPILEEDDERPDDQVWARASGEMMNEMEAAWGRTRELDSGIPIVSAIIDGAVQSGTTRIKTLGRELQGIEAEDAVGQALKRRRDLDRALRHLSDVAQGVDELEQAIRDIVQEERTANADRDGEFDCGATELHEEWELLEARFRRLDNQYRNLAQQEARRFSEFMGGIVAIVSALVIGPSLVFAAVAIPNAVSTQSPSESPPPPTGSVYDYTHLAQHALVGVGIGLCLILLAVLATLAIRALRRRTDLP